MGLDPPCDIQATELLGALRTAAALLDADAMVLAANDSFAEFFGLRRQDLVGQRVASAIEGWQDEAVDPVTAEGVAVSAQLTGSFGRDRRERTVIFSAAPVGGPQGLEAILVEVEELSDGRAARRDDATLAALVEGASDMVVRVGVDGSILWANETTLETLGYDELELVDRPFESILPARAGAETKALESAIGDPPGGAVLSWRVTSDGREIPVSVGIFPIFVGDEFVGTATVARDISDRVTAQRELARANRALNRKAADLEAFTYTVSHDLKSPLVTVTGFLGLAQAQVRAGEADEAVASMERAAAAAQRMGSMLEELLRFSRLGGRPLRKEHVATNDLLERLRSAFEPRLAAHAATIDIADGLPTMWAEETLLERALENLLANAVEHGCGEQGGTIRITGGSDPSAAWVSVEDDGAGIAASDQARVLRLFERGNNAGQGAGMGLSIVQRIVSLHDGDLRLESDGPGLGCRFTMSFPSSEGWG